MSAGHFALAIANLNDELPPFSILHHNRADETRYYDSFLFTYKRLDVVDL